MLAGFFDGRLHGVGISVGQHIHEEGVFPIFSAAGPLVDVRQVETAGLKISQHIHQCSGAILGHEHHRGFVFARGARGFSCDHQETSDVVAAVLDTTEEGRNPVNVARNFRTDGGYPGFIRSPFHGAAGGKLRYQLGLGQVGSQPTAALVKHLRLAHDLANPIGFALGIQRMSNFDFDFGVHGDVVFQEGIRVSEMLPPEEFSYGTIP